MGIILGIISFVVSGIIIFYVALALGIGGVLVGMKYCESNPTSTNCIQETKKFILANRRIEDRDLEVGHRDEVRNITRKYSNALEVLNMSATRQSAELLSNMSSRSSNMTQKDYQDAEAANHRLYLTERSTIEGRREKEISVAESQYRHKKEVLDKKYRQDTVTLYKQLQAAIK